MVTTHTRHLFRSVRIARILLGSFLSLMASGCGGGSGSTTATSAKATFQEFVVPVATNDPTDPPPGSWPDDLYADELGNIWFAEHHSNEIGRMSPTGVYTGFPVPTPNSVMDSIGVDTTRHLVWVSETETNQVARLDIATGKVTELTMPHPNSVPGDIIIAPDGSPWLTEGYEGGMGMTRLAKIDPNTNQITEFTPPIQRNGTDGLVMAANGDIWFVELYDNYISRFSNGQFTEFALPRPNVVPTNIGINSHNMIFVSEQQGNAIAILNPSTGQWQEIVLPTANGQPSGMFVDQHDNVWFTEFNSNKIGVMPAGGATITDYLIPTPNSGPEDVRSTANGSIYFTEQLGNKIGKIIVPGLTPAN